MTGLAGPGVRALVIGTATHAGPLLPSVPSAARSARAVRDVLVDVCRVPAEHVTLLLDPPEAVDMARAVSAAAAAAESVLFLYFAGHGLLDTGDELHLAASSTDRLQPGMSGFQALPYEAIRQAVAGCAAATVVLVLDCCYSGRARNPGAPREAGPGYTPRPVHGAYVLASAENLAEAPADAELTTFTGELVGLLRDGDRLAPPQLTLAVVYDRLSRRLLARGAPQPRVLSGDNAGDLVLAANPAARPPEPDSAEPPSPGASPYLGLASFGAGDAGLFFGRERAVDDLLAAAARARRAGVPLTVLGPSGAGKTSLLHAGLLAALHRGTGTPGLEGSARWPVLTLTPGERPAARLAARLGATDPAAGPTVIVADQLEQVFVLSPPAERDAFLTRLTALAAEHLVVLGLRDDFYPRAAERSELHRSLQEHPFLLRPMTPGQLRAVIEEPARAGGVRLEAGLADVMLHELGAFAPAAEPAAGGAALPLLSHALWATWDRRSGDLLTVAGYRAAGGVAQAVATTARQTYAALDPPARAALRRMLPKLVRVRDGDPDTVRPAARAELLRSLPDEAAGVAALERFTEARLVTQDRHTVRFAHEALLHGWPLLRTWLDEDRAWLRTAQRLAADAAAWQRAGHDPALLYRGSRLAEARAGDRGHGDVPPVARDFLAASERSATRAARVRRAVTAALAVLLVLAGAGVVVALTAQRTAVTERNRALARALSADAESLRDRQPGLAQQLALVAYDFAREEASEAVLASPGLAAQIDGEEKVFDVARDRAGRVLALAVGRAVVLWDLAAGAELSRLGPLFTGPVALSPDGTLLAAANGPLDGEGPFPVAADPVLIEQPRPEIRLWDVRDPRHPVALPTLASGERSITTLAFSADRRMLAGAGTGGRIHVWDTSDPSAVRQRPALTGHSGRVDSVAFSPAAPRLASIATDGTTRLWDLADPARPVVLARVVSSTNRPEPAVRVIQHRVGFDPSGRRLATVKTSPTTVAGGAQPHELPFAYDVTDPRSPRPLYQLDPRDECQHVNAVLAVAEGLFTTCPYTGVIGWTVALGQAGRAPLLSARRTPAPSEADTQLGAVLPWPGPDGTERILVAGTMGVLVRDVTNPVWPGAFASLTEQPNGVVERVRFSPAGRPLLAVGSGRDGSRIYDITDPRRPALIAAIRTAGAVDGAIGQEAGAGLAFSRDGTLLAAAQVENEKPRLVLLPTDHPDGAPLATITDLGQGAAEVSFSADGRLLAVADSGRSSASAEAEVKVYDVADPTTPRLVSRIPGQASDLSFGPVGRVLAVLTSRTLLVHDLSEPARPRSLRSWTFPADTSLPSAEFTPDGRHLVVGDNSRLLRVFELDGSGVAGEPVEVVSRTPSGNRRLAVSPDGTKLAVAGILDNSEIDLWDIRDPGAPRPRTSITLLDLYGVGALAFSRDGRFLAVKYPDRTDLWPADPAEVVESLCRLGGDPLTRHQWNLYVGDLPYDPPCR
ncbi:WD40 repeat domain-containing protein [Actinoplanes sp. RD1]|uniref:WD40 repeat domain-containing protein n=1 Tax=Actinoplanes sp. RD1 TaxID=3064538 RepID=UPI00274276A5|nr:WD40 repeat domain-containing protein [Actinoplanes sp. RD1]